MLEQLFARLNELYPEIVRLRRYFHMNPELSFHEEDTAKEIADYLIKHGIEVKTKVGGNGIVGIIRGGKSGKTVALRADFDALPIQDEKETEYKSRVPGVMHACGHDGHTSTLMHVAKVLNENKEDLHGNVVVIFQFAEELLPGGAKPMIEAGCLDNVDAIFGTHLWATIPAGQIGYRSGHLMAATDSFTIEIKGSGGHGGSPHDTVDSIMVGSSLVTNIQQIVSRRIDPLKSAVVSIGTFHAGHANNIIADTATITGTVRTFDQKVQDLIIEQLERIVDSTCRGAGAVYDFKYDKGYPAIYNHPEETTLFVDNASKTFGKENVKEIAPIMGGEDFSYYLKERPGSFFFVGAGNPEIGASYPHHHPKFDIDENAMLIAGKALLVAAIGYLEKHTDAE